MSNLSAQNQKNSPFDNIRRTVGNGNEYWLARELMLLLGYNSWQKFHGVIKRAKFSCINSGEPVDNHFIEADEVVEIKQGGSSKKPDYKLSRYGCYLVAMNGDPSKPEIAVAQRYFALKTCEAEIPHQNHLMSQLTIIQQQNQQMMAVLIASCQQQGIQLQEQVSQLKGLTVRIDEINRFRDDALSSIENISLPTVEVKNLSSRAKLNRLVRDYAVANSVPFRDVWNKLYAEFRDRYHIDLVTRSKNNGKLKPLDICEQLQMIEELYAVASFLLVMRFPQAS